MDEEVLEKNGGGIKIGSYFGSSHGYSRSMGYSSRNNNNDKTWETEEEGKIESYESPPLGKKGWR